MSVGFYWSTGFRSSTADTVLLKYLIFIVKLV